jgi:xylulokinase
LIVSGGSSVNETILQMAADIFGLSVFVNDGCASAEAACMGAAKLAAYAWGVENGQGIDHSAWPAPPQHNNFRSAIQPRDPNTQIYRGLLDVYRASENEALRIYVTSQGNGQIPSKDGF